MDYPQAGVSDASTNGASEGLAAGLTTGMVVFVLIVAVLSVIGLWKIFTKAGKPGWAALVPAYNMIVWPTDCRPAGVVDLSHPPGGGSARRLDGISAVIAACRLSNARIR